MRTLAAAAAVAATLVALARRPDGGPRAPGASPVAAGGVRLELGPDPGNAGFARVTAAREFGLPADHGPHFEYQTEWWYFTGNLVATGGERFGFQLTFFRRGLSPGPPPPGPDLESNQVFFADFAITDAAAGRHVASERFSRGAGGLAGAEAGPVRIWLENWSADWTRADAGGLWHLSARDAASALSLDLDLCPEKPLVAHGDRGVSAKGDEPGNASYYVGYTRLAARGRLGLGTGLTEASGEAWFDHEWSTSALGPGAVGWDWFSLQLDDGRELMEFQIRRSDGSIEAVSAGTLVERDGRTRRLARDEVAIEVLRRWRSPRTGATYPSGWRVRVPSERLDLLVEPLVEDQEMRVSFVYWEGAVRVAGSAGGGPVSGEGYVELTGYARSMQDVF